MFNRGTIFKFEGSKLEITVSEYRGSRQRDLNSGVEINVSPAKTRITIGCNNFRSDIQMGPLSKQGFAWQAAEINKLIELIETIQNQGSQADLVKLALMKTCINDVCLKALSWYSQIDSEKAKLNPYHYLIPGKRVSADTFELVDAEPKTESKKTFVLTPSQ
jgi:hypothetical protein